MKPEVMPSAAGYRPHLRQLPERHPAHELWAESQDEDRTEDIARLEEYHDARSRWISLKGASEVEATEGARLGLRAVIAHEVADPDEALRQCRLIDEVAACYLEPAA